MDTSDRMRTLQVRKHFGAALTATKMVDATGPIGMNLLETLPAATLANGGYVDPAQLAQVGPQRRRGNGCDLVIVERENGRAGRVGLLPPQSLMVIGTP